MENYQYECIFPQCNKIFYGQKGYQQYLTHFKKHKMLNQLNNPEKFFRLKQKKNQTQNVCINTQQLQKYINQKNFTYLGSIIMEAQLIYDQFNKKISKGYQIFYQPTECLCMLKERKNYKSFAQLKYNQSKYIVPLLKQNFIKMYLYVQTIPEKIHIYSSFQVEAKIYLYNSRLTNINIFKQRKCNKNELKKKKQEQKNIINLFNRLKLNKIASSLIKQNQRKNLNQHIENKQKQNKFDQKNEINDKYALFVNNQDNLIPIQPSQNFKEKLMDHQACALSWMINRQKLIQFQRYMHPQWAQYQLQNGKSIFFNQLYTQISIQPPIMNANCRGGILADDMGLGKTATMCSLISYPQLTKQVLDKQKYGKNLIIVPPILIQQWKQQINKFIQGFNTLIYHGKNQNINNLQINKYDVVITTYFTIGSQYQKQYHKTYEGIYKYVWNRIILDQAHYIKNKKAILSKSIFALEGIKRWCLKGTPIQNGISDLFSLIHFLKYKPWSQFQWWNKYIQNSFKQNNQIYIQILKIIFKNIFLRRTKQTRDKQGKLLIELPSKIERPVYVDLSKQQRQKYQQIQYGDYQKSQNMQNIQIERTLYFQKLLKLQQFCCHPLLYQGWKKQNNTEQRVCQVCQSSVQDGLLTVCLHFYCNLCAEQIINEKRCVICSKSVLNNNLIKQEKNNNMNLQQRYYDNEKLKKITQQLNKNKNDKTIIFSQFLGMMDIIQHKLKKQNINYLRIDGKTRPKQRFDRLKLFQNSNDVKVFLLSLKTANIGLNLVAANKVFLVDLWWNPAVQQQAIQRIYRYGQKKQVQVIRFITTNTVQTRMQQINKKKKKFSENILQNSGKKVQNQLKILRQLFARY